MEHSELMEGPAGRGRLCFHSLNKNASASCLISHCLCLTISNLDIKIDHACVFAALSWLAAAGILAGSASAQSCTFPLTATLSGYSGQYNGSINVLSPRLGGYAPCGTAGSLQSTRYSAMLAIDLPSFSPGTPIQIDACGSVMDTFVGAVNSCNSTVAPFTCLAGNDDMTSDYCTSGASRITLNVTSSRVYVVVQEYSGGVGEWG